YWDEHKISRKQRSEVASRYAKRVKLLRSSPSLLTLDRWQTTRDSLRDLPDPEFCLDHKIPNHVFTPGARTYVGHTGSFLDEPSKTLKAGYHGVPGGENMFIKDDGTVRYF